MYNKQNYLKLYIGCMFSGKSTSLLNEISKYKHITDNILIINHKLDEERGTFGEIKTHDNKIYKAHILSKLEDIYNSLSLLTTYETSDVIIIDECQFFEDIYDFLAEQLKRKDKHKIFIVGGLSGDSELNLIGNTYKLLPLADEIIKLNAYCSLCKNGTYASFTKRIVNNSSQILIGKDNYYIPVCRTHYLC